MSGMSYLLPPLLNMKMCSNEQFFIFSPISHPPHTWNVPTKACFVCVEHHSISFNTKSMSFQCTFHIWPLFLIQTKKMHCFGHIFIIWVVILLLSFIPNTKNVTKMVSFCCSAYLDLPITRTHQWGCILVVDSSSFPPFSLPSYLKHPLFIPVHTLHPPSITFIFGKYFIWYILNNYLIE